VAPFVIYLIAEELHGSGVLAVVVAALIIGQRNTEAGYATRLQDDAVWRAVQLLLESFAFLLIGLQLPQAVREMRGIEADVVLVSSVAVFTTVLVVRIAWVFGSTYLLPYRADGHDDSARPRPAQVFVVAWAGMRGVVSLAAAFGVPLVMSTGQAFPGRPSIIFLTFVVVIGTLLLHGLTLPWVIRYLGVGGESEAKADALAIVVARTKAADAAAARLDELLAKKRSAGTSTDVYERGAEVLRRWNDHRRNAAWEEQLGRGPEELGASPTAAVRKLRLAMLTAEREALIGERDTGKIDDEVLRALLHDLDLEEAAFNR